MVTEFPEYYMKFGLNVSYYRKLRGYTQQSFADALGVSISHIGKIESTSELSTTGVSMELIFKMARELDIPPIKLFDFDR